MKYLYKKQPIYLLIDNQLFKKIEGLIEQNNKIHTQGQFNLKMDFAVFIIDTISRKSAQKKTKYVRLKAKYLKHLQWNYNCYMNFFLRHKILQRLPYNTAEGKCFGYMIIYSPSLKKRFIKYEPLNFTFKAKIRKYFDDRKIKADKSTYHLTKWLNSEHISFDYESAIEYLHGSNLKDSQLCSRRHFCEMLNVNLWYYCREGKDNRLHSNLTTLPSDLKPFITNNGNRLVSLDLKSSQPFILAGLLNLIVKEKYNELEYLLNKKVVEEKKRENKLRSTLSVMIPKSLEPTAIIELKAFIEQVEHSDIYDYIGTKFSIEFLKKVKTDEGFEDKFFNKDLGYKVKTKFKTLRDYSKRVMLEYLYCSPKSNESRYKELIEMFPNALNEFVDSLKETNLKLGFTKNDFAIILQNIESHIFLDVASVEFADRYPDTFIATVHDSLIVPKEYEGKAREILEKNLFKFFNLNPEIKTEVISSEVVKMSNKSA